METEKPVSETADAEELRRLFIEHVGVPPECRELHVVLGMLDRAINAYCKAESENAH